ncbi:hypothetical protein GGR52DRAFT_486558 [Hypoxylon sp. FL1284]|nr:hypothetical protein GGR52DRAFT_486558 [Hypoxylon sp. FL1284]
MRISQAYDILDLASGASRAEIEKAFRRKALLHHPDRIGQCRDKDEQEARSRRATENMKLINAARTVLLEAANAYPESGDEVPRTKRRGPEHKGEPVRRIFSTQGLAEIKMEFNNPDMIGRKDFVQQFGKGAKYAPTEFEYRSLLRDLADLHAKVCRTADEIEAITHTRQCKAIWEQIWLTLHMVGSTTEDVWDIVRYRWFATLQRTATLGPGEWERLKRFIEAARETTRKCDRILYYWEPRRERGSCFRLYRALREFPISAQKKRDPAWRSQDEVTQASMYSI